MKIVVFDLDETLGSFTQYGVFWDSLKKYVNLKNKKELTQMDFNEMLDLYPEFLRPNIINILNYLKTKKQSNCCHKMMIYTNNTGSYEWSRYIVKYFENKLNYVLIDQIISAFKINNKRVELCRTTHNKTHNDLIKCTKIPLNTEICFIDDMFHPKMVSDNVYYINIKPYYYDLPFDEMINRFLLSNIGKQIVDDDEDFETLMTEHVNAFNYLVLDKNEKELKVDNVLGKQIMLHLHIFFNKTIKNKTAKNKTNKNRTNKNRTVKNR